MPFIIIIITICGVDSTRLETHDSEVESYFLYLTGTLLSLSSDSGDDTEPVAGTSGMPSRPPDAPPTLWDAHNMFQLLDLVSPVEVEQQSELGAYLNTGYTNDGILAFCKKNESMQLP